MSDQADYSPTKPRTKSVRTQLDTVTGFEIAVDDEVVSTTPINTDASEATSLLGSPTKSRSGSFAKKEAQQTLYRWLIVIIIITIIFAVVIFSVTFVLKRNPSQNILSGCVFSYDPKVNYFPERVESAYNANFTATYENNYKIFTNTLNQEENLQVQCGTPAPTNDSTLKLFETPVTLVANTLPSSIAFIELLGRRNTIKLQDEAASVVSPCVQYLLGKDTIVPLKTTPASLRVYQLSSVKLFLGDAALVETQLNQVTISTMVESNPLAAAEWIKVVASFFNLEYQANVIFQGIQSRYICQHTRVINYLNNPANSPIRPNVAFVAYDDADPESWTLYASPRNKALVEDAGGQVAHEYKQFFNATDLLDELTSVDFLFEIGSVTTTWRSFLIDYDPITEYSTSLPFMQANHVYRLDKIINQEEFSDWFETGYAQPDVALQDMISILQPSLLPDYTRHWIRNLESESSSTWTSEECLDRTPDGLAAAIEPLGLTCSN